MQVRSAAYIVLTVLAWALRACAIGLCAITVCLCSSSLASLSWVSGLATQLAYALPASIAGYGLIASPFGGVFRLDFALLALLLFFGDFACTWAASKLLG